MSEEQNPPREDADMPGENSREQITNSNKEIADSTVSQREVIEQSESVEECDARKV